MFARDLGARGSREAVADADPAGTRNLATQAILAAVPAWWSRRAQTAGLSGDWLDVFCAIDTPGVPVDEPVRPAPMADLSPEEVGQAYVESLDNDVRARHGRHYTPRILARELWTMTRAALGWSRPMRPLEGLVRDPACGAGALLLPPLREHLRAATRAEPRVVIAGVPNHIEGIDADPAASWIASVMLAAEMLPLLAQIPASKRRPLPALARCGDGLHSSLRPARAIVLNPPYGRVRLSEEDRRRFAPVLHGHANLYAMFVGAAVDSLDERGAVGALIPTSFTAGLYFSALRQYLSDEAPLHGIAFVADRSGVFAGVLQETCLAAFGRRRSRRTRITAVSAETVEVAKVRPPKGHRPWLLPRRADDAHIAATAAQMPSTLASAGWRVSTGPLVWNRRKGDLSDQRRAGYLPIIWASDLEGGNLHRDASRDHVRFIRLRDATDTRINALSEPAILVQRTTSPEQRRRIVVAPLGPDELALWGSTVVVENHVNVLRPIPDQAPLLSHDCLTAVLATDAIDRVMRCLSGSVAVSAYELESLPLPPADVLKAWSALSGPALDEAVTAAYRTGPS